MHFQLKKYKIFLDKGAAHLGASPLDPCIIFLHLAIVIMCTGIFHTYHCDLNALWDQSPNRWGGGGGTGSRVPPETSDREISADLPEKGGKGKWSKKEGGKFGEEERIFFFCFLFFLFCFSLFTTRGGTQIIFRRSVWPKVQNPYPCLRIFLTQKRAD